MLRYVIFQVGATLSSLHLRHSSFFNPCVVSPTSQLILQLFCSFTYVKSTSHTSQTLHLRHKHFTYVIWRAAHDTIVYTLILYMRLIAPYVEGNATHDRGSILLIQYNNYYTKHCLQNFRQFSYSLRKFVVGKEVQYRA